MCCTAIQDYIERFGIWNVSLFALLCILLILLVIFILFRRRQPKNIIAYSTENGSVTINRSAVVELVRTACEQLAQITKPNLKIFVKKGLTHFNIRIQLISGSSLKDLESTLQNHLRQSLSQDLGIESLGNINIIVTSFKGSRVRSPNMPVNQIPPALPVSEQDLDEKTANDPEKM